MQEGRTPLHLAAIKDRRVLAAILYKGGAEVDSRDNNDMTPLQKAAVCGHADMVEDLIKHGAHVNYSLRVRTRPQDRVHIASCSHVWHAISYPPSCTVRKQRVTVATGQDTLMGRNVYPYMLDLASDTIDVNPLCQHEHVSYLVLHW